MKSMSVAGLAIIPVSGADPAHAALPRLTGNNLDFILMPLLGYLDLVVASRYWTSPPAGAATGPDSRSGRKVGIVSSWGMAAGHAVS